jgi:NAD(P)H-dependent flavin oxidoreductase YrpB (nitropropane dioxygenase family)
MTHVGTDTEKGALPSAFTTLTGCTVPIQLAAMGGGVVTTALAAAVSGAGGFGMLNRTGSIPLATRVRELETAGVGPFGINVTPFDPDGRDRPDRAEVEFAAQHARLVEFFWAEPNPDWIGWVHSAGSLAGWQVGSVAEARRATDAGCDLIVVQGVEAGGHVRGSMGLLPLLDGVLERVTVPVLAAGGITTARSMAAVMAAGAAGVRIGTRFLATLESGAHPAYVAALLAADGESTVLTELFSLGWPDAPHRVLAAAAATAQARKGPTVGTLADTPILRLSAQAPNRDVIGDIAAMALYAGQGIGQVNRVVPAAQVVTELASGARRLLALWGASLR